MYRRRVYCVITRTSLEAITYVFNVVYVVYVNHKICTKLYALQGMLSAT